MGSPTGTATVRARTTRCQSGYALITVMLAITCFLPLAAFALMQARLDFLIAHQTRAGLEAVTVAESGLEHALADLATDPRFERLLCGPDRLAGTGDDSEYPFIEAPPPFFPRAPFHYDVRVVRRAADRVDLIARGLGSAGAVRSVGATVLQATLPYAPAAVATAAVDMELALGSAFTLRGLAPDATTPGLPALAVARESTAEALRTQLGSDAARIVGAGGTPSIATAGLPDLAALVKAAAARDGARQLGSDAYGALGDGLFVRRGGLRLADASGSGVLLVAGGLELGGTVAFSGLIVALGDVRADTASDAAIDGALLQGSAGRVLLLRGAGHIGYDRQVIERIDRDFPGLLPRQARVTGWRSFDDAGA